MVRIRYRVNTTFEDGKEENNIEVSIVVDKIEDIDDKLLEMLEKDFFSSHNYKKVDVKKIMEID